MQQPSRPSQPPGSARSSNNSNGKSAASDSSVGMDHSLPQQRQPRRRSPQDALFEFSKIQRRPAPPPAAAGRAMGASTGSRDTCSLTLSSSTADTQTTWPPSNRRGGAAGRDGERGLERAKVAGGAGGLVRSNHLLPGCGGASNGGGGAPGVGPDGMGSLGLVRRNHLPGGGDGDGDDDGGGQDLSAMAPNLLLQELLRANDAAEAGSDGERAGRRGSSAKSEASDDRHESAGSEASWPVESPDPLSATARGWEPEAARASPPGSPEGGPAAGAEPSESAAAWGGEASTTAEVAGLYKPKPVRRRRSTLESMVTCRSGDGRSDDDDGSDDDEGGDDDDDGSKTSVDSIAATIVFVDVEGYSKCGDRHQQQLTCEFMGSVRNLLTFAYGKVPVRGDVEDYVILPTGDGAAVIVVRPPPRAAGRRRGGDASLRTTEETALWIGASLLLWASHLHIGLRVGLNSGELSIVEDPYGDPNVCGDAINMAARIMDTALPGQILVSSSTVVPQLNALAAEDLARSDPAEAREGRGDGRDDGATGEEGEEGEGKPRDRPGDPPRRPRIEYEIADAAYEVVVKHGVTTNVQSVRCALHPLPRPEDLPPDLRPPAPTGPSRKPATRRSGGAVSQSWTHGFPRVTSRQRAGAMSFASLSSMSAPSSEGSLVERQERGKYSAAGRNASWMLDNSGDLGDLLAAHRLPISREPSAGDGSEDSNEATGSSREVAASNAASAQQRQPQRKQPQPADVPQLVGNHRTPATKWYMKIKPTEMRSSSNNRIKPKVLPQELIRRHRRIAFLGITQDSLHEGFLRILERDPSHRWDQVYVFFPSDACLRDHLANNYQDKLVETLISNKRECHSALAEVLAPVVRDLRFLQYDELMHCGSYWDWRDPGGFIHVSPLTWGANPKTCPAMNYYWNSKIPSPEYRVYRDGLEFLLDTAIPFEETVVEGGGG